MSENDLKVAKLIALENVITIVVCSILVLGLYYMGLRVTHLWASQFY